MAQSSRRERQRIALGITADVMAGELGITVEQLTVLEARAESFTRENAGRAWDLALGRIVHAREDAVRDAKTAVQEQQERGTDALRQWSGKRKGGRKAAAG